MKQFEIKISNSEVNYEEAVMYMESRVDGIINNKSEELIWFLNHNHIFTQGTSASKEEILNADIIDVIKSNRGGKTTYHGPGQRIVYFMLNLNNKNKDIRKFITIIENSLISFLANYNIEAQTFKDRVGVWVTKSNNISFDKEKKIGAIGLRIKKWITYHGLSFNINPDLKYYSYIHPCGLKEYQNTSMEELGIKLDQSEFDNKFKEIFIEKLRTI
jgi:lipoyl(octanoyl) transferase